MGPFYSIQIGQLKFSFFNVTNQRIKTKEWPQAAESEINYLNLMSPYYLPEIKIIEITVRSSKEKETVEIYYTTQSYYSKFDVLRFRR